MNNSLDVAPLATAAGDAFAQVDLVSFWPEGNTIHGDVYQYAQFASGSCSILCDAQPNSFIEGFDPTTGQLLQNEATWNAGIDTFVQTANSASAVFSPSLRLILATLHSYGCKGTRPVFRRGNYYGGGNTQGTLTTPNGTSYSEGVTALYVNADSGNGYRVFARQLLNPHVAQEVWGGVLAVGVETDHPTSCAATNGGWLTCGFQLLIGSDLDALRAKDSSVLQKLVAVVDLASNVLMLIPGAGELADATIKDIAAQALKDERGHLVHLSPSSSTDLRDVNSNGSPLTNQVVNTLERGTVTSHAPVIKDPSLNFGTLSDLDSTNPIAFIAPCAVLGQSFPAGTLVATPKGEQAIQTLHIGDEVLAEDPALGRVEPEAVQAVIVDPVAPLLRLHWSDGSTLEVTTNHPLYLEHGKRGTGWRTAGSLHVGDEVRTATGVVRLTRIERNVARALVYTLTVANDHTFFVGLAQALVHNASRRCNRFNDNNFATFDPNQAIAGDSRATNVAKDLAKDAWNLKWQIVADEPIASRFTTVAFARVGDGSKEGKIAVAVNL